MQKICLCLILLIVLISVIAQTAIAAVFTAQKPQKILPQSGRSNFGNINSYTNPFLSNFTISFKLLQKDDAGVEMYDSNGVVVYQARFNSLTEGDNYLKIVPKNSLSTGV
jgi:hypothetical protein